MASPLDESDRPVSDIQFIPVIPIRNAVLFPAVSMPLAVGRERSVQAVSAAKEGGRCWY